MNQKQNSTANGRSLASSHSPQWSGRPSFLPKKVDSPASCTSPPIQRSTPLNTGSRTKDRDNKQAIDTPVKAFLSSNITPRSSSRKARAESTSSTPNGTPSGTPNNSRPSSVIYSQDRGPEYFNENSTLGIRRPSTGRTVRSSSISSDRQTASQSFRPPSRERELHSAKATGSGNNPKFFHADDIRPALTSIPSERVIEQGTTNGFVLPGGGDDGRTGRAFLSSSPPVEEPRPKFFYANDVVESTPAPKLPTSRITKAPYPIRTGASPTTSSGPQQKRATSPLKEEIVSRKSSLSKPRRHTRLVSNPNVGVESDLRSPEPISISQANTSRRSSLISPATPLINHARSPSVEAVAPISVRRGSLAWSEGPIVDSPKIYPTAAPESSQDTEQIPSTLHEQPQTPTAGKATLGQSKLDHMNELAANARRERKVLDLEISNSSLLAINRTLEREMRKQNAELRRFRRRSQPGRLSAISASRSTSHTLSILSESDQIENDSDDLSGGSSPSGSIDEDESLNDTLEGSPSSNTSHQLSISLSASRAARLRDKDTKRIHLDLVRHRELLVDSQKLNESIKRCLGRTEDLIADGKKALDYHVQMGGVETHGGRVLLPDELNDGEVGHQRQGLLSPGVNDKKGMAWETGGSKEEEDDIEDYSQEIDDDSESSELDDDPESREPDDDSVPLPDPPIADIKLNQPKPLKLLPPATKSPPQSPSSERNEWDRIRSDVQTPDEETSGTGVNGGVQGLKEYLASLGPAWGL